MDDTLKDEIDRLAVKGVSSGAFEVYDGNIRLEINVSKLGKGLIFMNLINLKTGEIMQKTRNVDFLINRLWSKTVLRRRGWR